jgi:ADP-ribose pyrophosphatase YjhB (NUDIX family)
MVMIDDSWYIRPSGVRHSTSAGGIVVRIEQSQAWIALVREAGFHQYILPKGRLEPGEDVESAARREIEEEAGLSDLQQVAYLGASQRLNFKRNRWITVHYYLFLTRQKSGQPTDQDHLYHCEWFRLDDLPEFFWPDQRQLVLDTLPRIHALLAEEIQD